jgi:hypothetical protein
MGPPCLLSTRGVREGPGKYMKRENRKIYVKGKEWNSVLAGACHFYDQLLRLIHFTSQQGFANV